MFDCIFNTLGTQNKNALLDVFVVNQVSNSLERAAPPQMRCAVVAC